MEDQTTSSELVVIDSSIFIDYLRQYDQAVSFMASFTSLDMKQVFFSAITETELLAGKSCNDTVVRSIVLRMLSSIVKIEVTNQIALRAGDICRMYGVALPDSIIAASALVYKAELLTKNVKDFTGIPGLRVRAPY